MAPYKTGSCTAHNSYYFMCMYSVLKCPPFAFPLKNKKHKKSIKTIATQKKKFHKKKVSPKKILKRPKVI